MTVGTSASHPGCGVASLDALGCVKGASWHPCRVSDVDPEALASILDASIRFSSLSA